MIFWKYIVNLVLIVSLLFGTTYAPQVQAETAKPGMIGTAVDCAALLLAATAAAIALGELIAVLPAAFSALSSALSAAIAAGDWVRVRQILDQIAARLNAAPTGYPWLGGVLTKAIQAVQKVLDMMAGAYKNCARPGIEAAEVMFGPPEGGVPGRIEIPPGTCGHEDVPGQGWALSCIQCCKKHVDESNAWNCPASSEPQQTWCSNLVNKCAEGCQIQRDEIANRRATP